MRYLVRPVIARPPTRTPLALATGLAISLAGSLAGLGALVPGCTGGIDGGPVNSAVEVGASRFPRLTHEQWRNATRDLLRLDATPTNVLNEGQTTGLFGNVGGELSVSSSLWTQYRDASEALALAATADADALNRILPDGLPTDPAARARGFIEGFGLRAYRRPLTSAEVSTYEGLFGAAAPLFETLDPFTAGVRHVVATMLQSPNFLYRVERSTELDPNVPGAVPLDGWELATRMSFALWNSIPDDELLRAAGAGELATEAGVRAQANRMVAMPAADVMLLDFHQHLLGVSSYIQITRQASVFPEYSEALRDISLPGEVDHFINDVIVDRDGGLRELMTSHHTFVDERLARVYDVPGIVGDEFQRVELDPTERSGVLTMAGFLAANATSTETDPIHRGVFINRRFLCSTLPAPPNAVPPLPDAPTPMTMRERVDRHTGMGTCGASCHGVFINPIGFAFERFDAMGRVQITERTSMLPIDTASDFVFDGMRQSYDGAVELAEIIAESPDAHRCYAGHLAEYLFGDRPVRRIVSARSSRVSLDENGGARRIAVEIVADPLFRSRPATLYTGPWTDVGTPQRLEELNASTP